MSSNNLNFQVHKEQLLSIAKLAVTTVVTQHVSFQPTTQNYPKALQQQRACFVTLNINKKLRGCIGSLTAHQALYLEVAASAEAAAIHDPRFNRISDSELDQLEYHISILSPSSPITFKSEDDLMNQIRPNVDGLILSEGNQRGTFLPSVWESLPDVNDFLKHLKCKVGLSENYWSNSIQMSRYTTESISSI